MSDALERLIEAVAAGTFTMDSDPSIPAHLGKLIDDALGDKADLWADVVGADAGSMDDAQILLAALLPDHDWGRTPGGQMWVQRPPAAPVWSGDGYPPARGLLLAILRAYAGERVSETADR